MGNSLLYCGIGGNPTGGLCYLPFVESLESLFLCYSQEGMQHASISHLYVEPVQSLSLYLEPRLCCINGKRT